MSFIDHKAKVTKEEIKALLQDLENPVIALLNKRHAEVNPLEDAGEIIRIHNATIKAIEDLNVRVSRIESQLGLNSITK
jgi:arsenate reductase-like glutaredoxin family protein